ncbi:MAG: hypothetical protein ABJP48_12960 [Erythrobacter sp.]
MATKHFHGTQKTHTVFIPGKFRYLGDMGMGHCNQSEKTFGAVERRDRVFANGPMNGLTNRDLQSSQPRDWLSRTGFRELFDSNVSRSIAKLDLVFTIRLIGKLISPIRANCATPIGGGL